MRSLRISRQRFFGFTVAIYVLILSMADSLKLVVFILYQSLPEKSSLSALRQPPLTFALGSLVVDATTS